MTNTVESKAFLEPQEVYELTIKKVLQKQLQALNIC